MGLIPKQTSLSNNDWFRPAFAAFLHMITGPSWQWSPTRIACWAFFKRGRRVSGSVACVASSINTYLKWNAFNRLSKAATQVVQMTSAFFRISRSAWLFRFLRLFSSFSERNPSSSFLTNNSCICLNGPCSKCLICSCKAK